MLVRGRAKKVSIRLTNEARSAHVGSALLAFLTAKDVCCLQVFDLGRHRCIEFLARPVKAITLIQTVRLIAPGGLIQVADTTIVHAASSMASADLAPQRANWEAPVP